jgi:peptidoglycan/xylan/chitin deacetylase (PgdA/CDA1 family)
MHYLSKSFSFVSLYEVVEHINQGKKLPPHPVAITIDDGFRCSYTNAYPVLKKYGVPATIFLIVNCIEAQEIPWFEKINHFFGQTRENRFTWHLYETKEYSFDTRAERMRVAREIKEKLKLVRENTKKKIIEEISYQLNMKNNKQKAERLMLTWDEVSEMADSGILFGSHTLNHPILTKLSKEQVKYEVNESRRIIEQKIGVPIHHIAYPNGGKLDFNSEIQEIIREAGYTCALASIRGLNTQQTDTYELRRSSLCYFLIRLFFTNRAASKVHRIWRMMFGD